ncbi:MAG TPA: sensor histidine kinase, partial [Myxococcaceae bacterium]
TVACDVSVVDVPDDLWIHADAEHVRRVIANLLTNAIKYGGGKPVRVNVEQQAEMAALTVTDQGIGIAPKDQARIFNRFERATTTRQSDSLGLGLFITREIVIAHGGTITVNSEPSRGTTFQVLLPLRRTERY